MSEAVIDTNILLIANNSHPDISIECRKVCVEKLLKHQQFGVVVIDDGHRVLSEYLNKTRPNQPKGVGDVFLKWLLQNQHNPQRVRRVSINEETPDVFSEFPDKDLEAGFDAPDRKFAAISNACEMKPPIWQAADCKWLNWWEPLSKKGVTVEFLCPDDACSFYKKKFPRKKIPPLP